MGDVSGCRLWRVDFVVQTGGIDVSETQSYGGTKAERERTSNSSQSHSRWRGNPLEQTSIRITASSGDDSAYINMSKPVRLAWGQSPLLG